MLREIQVSGRTLLPGCEIVFPDAYTMADRDAIWKAVRKVQAERRIEPYDVDNPDEDPKP